MIPEDVLKIVAEKLENCGIAYMIVGSFASNVHGKPRTTHDADMVIEIDEPSLEKFVQALGNDFYFDAAIQRRREYRQSSGQKFGSCLSSPLGCRSASRKFAERTAQRDQ